MATIATPAKPIPRAAQVESEADNILTRQSRPERDAEVAALAQQRRLKALAKVELLNQPQPPEAKAGKHPYEFDPDVLAGITKKLAENHQVPDAVASQAVMQAYTSLQQSWIQQDMSNQQVATKELSSIAAANPAPKVPFYADLTKDAENRMTNASTRRNGPSPKA
ncbi:hypothetical protein ABIC83_002529 [Roseateles asaccharophilus]|uniref:hypothetical protein n=1 Tax=Roseateles asaccharophilus TaxID=582607 RepID=UPI003832D640